MTKTSRGAPEQQEHTNQENKEEETTNNRPYAWQEKRPDSEIESSRSLNRS
jgi:hypothetical protein